MTREEKAGLLDLFCGRNEEPCKYCKLETYCVRADGSFSKLTDLELDSALALIAEEEIETEPPVDNVNHPVHYTAGGIECIDALKAATVNLTGIDAVCTANAIKYLWRWKNKNGVEDLKKAKWYIDRLVEECLMSNGREK